MYLFEKQGSGIKVCKLVPNMDEIRKLKEQEVYGKHDYLTLNDNLDYLRMLRAETSKIEPLEVLLEDNDPETRGKKLNAYFYKRYHLLEEDKNLTEEEAFANLKRVIDEPLLKTVKYLSFKNYLPYIISMMPETHYVALTNPTYVDTKLNNGKLVREMKGIVPISERLYYANELVRLIQGNDLVSFYEGLPDDYIALNPQLLEIKNIFAPNLWLSYIEDLYEHGLIDGSITDVHKKLEISDEIMSRIRRK